MIDVGSFAGAGREIQQIPAALAIAVDNAPQRRTTAWLNRKVSKAVQYLIEQDVIASVLLCDCQAAA